MKILGLIICGTFFLLLISCKRENEINDLQTKKEFLAGDTLIYDEEIVNWKLDSQRVVFKRGSASNVLPLENAWVKYNLNDSFRAMLPNGSIPYGGKWQLQNNGGKIRLTSTDLSYDETYEVIKITKDTFEWFDPSRSVFFRQVAK
jgi:hypothetical protein